MTGSAAPPDSPPKAAPQRRLLLLRHARAWHASDAGESADHARDLDARGRRDATALGDTMRRLGLKPDLVLVSSALRTRRTLELLGAFDEPAPQTQVVDQLYLAEAPELLDSLHAAPDGTGTLLLVGHNPGLHMLALLLAGAAAPVRLRDGMPTCTLAEFLVDTPWCELHPRNVRLVQVVGA